MNRFHPAVAASFSLSRLAPAIAATTTRTCPRGTGVPDSAATADGTVSGDSMASASGRRIPPHRAAWVRHRTACRRAARAGRRDIGARSHDTRAAPQPPMAHRHTRCVRHRKPPAPPTRLLSSGAGQRSVGSPRFRTRGAHVFFAEVKRIARCWSPTIANSTASCALLRHGRSAAACAETKAADYIKARPVRSSTLPICGNERGHQKSIALYQTASTARATPKRVVSHRPRCPSCANTPVSREGADGRDAEYR